VPPSFGAAPSAKDIPQRRRAGRILLALGALWTVGALVLQKRHPCLPIRHPAVNRCCKAPRDRTAMKPVLDTGPGQCLIASIRTDSSSLGKWSDGTDQRRNLLKNRRENFSMATHTPSARRGGGREAGGQAASASAVPPLRPFLLTLLAPRSLKLAGGNTPSFVQSHARNAHTTEAH
jgi:hypothetical protein